MAAKAAADNADDADAPASGGGRRSVASLLSSDTASLQGAPATILRLERAHAASVVSSSALKAVDAQVLSACECTTRATLLYPCPPYPRQPYPGPIWSPNLVVSRAGPDCRMRA